jgi:RNA polymerase sigma-70 factor (ECF subfamily)
VQLTPDAQVAELLGKSFITMDIPDHQRIGGSVNTDAEDEPHLLDVSFWSDASLITAVRRDPLDEAALDALVERYWGYLFSRCRMLTVDTQKATDLAQDAWHRVLRARHTLKPDGNFPAYLNTIATNLWRDSYRSRRRAGPLAENRVASLDAPLGPDGDETITLADVVPDLNSMDSADQQLLAMDIDHALQQLTPHLREVLVSRFIVGESAAEIGRRFNRTEQTVSGWLREAIRIMKQAMEEPAQPAGPPLNN